MQGVSYDAVIWFALGVVFLVSVQLFLSAVKDHSRNLMIAQVALDDAYEGARALIQDETTPDGVVNYIATGFKYVGRPSFTRVLTVVLLFRLFFRGNLPANSSENSFSGFSKMLTPVQSERLTKFVQSGIISCIKTDFFFSGLYFPIWKFLISMHRNQNTYGESPIEAISKFFLDRPLNFNFQNVTKAGA